MGKSYIGYILKFIVCVGNLWCT